MSELGRALITAFSSFRSNPEGVEKALEAFIDERIALAKKARKPRREKFEEHPDFRAWYAIYPRHEAPLDAARAFSKAIRTIPLQTLTEAAKRYAGQVAGADRQLIKLPATWLNKGCWADEYPAPVERQGRPSKILQVLP